MGDSLPTDSYISASTDVGNEIEMCETGNDVVSWLVKNRPIR